MRKLCIDRLPSVNLYFSTTLLINLKWLYTNFSQIHEGLFRWSYLVTTRCVPQEKCPWKLYSKFLIDQACSVKMAGYCPRSFFCVLMDLNSVGQYPVILTSHLVNNPYRDTFQFRRNWAPQNTKPRLNSHNISSLKPMIRCYSVFLILF